MVVQWTVQECIAVVIKIGNARCLSINFKLPLAHLGAMHFHCHCPPHMPTHKMFSALSTINVYNLIHIETSLVINFSPNKCLGCIVSMFLPLYEPLAIRPCCSDLSWSSRWWRCHWCPSSPTWFIDKCYCNPIHGLIQMWPFELWFKCHKRCSSQTGFTGFIVNGYALGQTHIFVICGCFVKDVASVVGHAIHHSIFEDFLGHLWYMDG